MTQEQPHVPTEEDVAALNKQLQRRAQRQQLLQSLEMRLGLPTGYIERLYQEPDDWSFIIKLAVLTEAAVTRAIVLHLKSDQLYDHVAGISNYQRLELALKLEILEKGDVEILSVLAAVRNSFAHNVKNLERTLGEYFLGLQQDRKVDVLTKLVRLTGKDKPKAKEDFSGHAKFFKLLIYSAVVKPLLSIATQGQAAQREEELKKWGEEVSSTGSLGGLFQVSAEALSK